MARASAADAIPWWAFGLLALCLVQYVEQSATPWQRSEHHGAQPRQLVDLLSMVPEAPKKLPVPCVMTFIQPCGNLTIPREGLDFKTPFGKYHVPGEKVLEPQMKMFHHAFAKYTVYFCGAGAAIYACLMVLMPQRRNRLMRRARETFAGKLEDSDSDEEPPTAKEIEEERRDRMDPKSDKFIAPGNIYRLMAVMHPGIIGWRLYCHYAFKAGVVAYMQLYLPFKICCHVIREWQFFGVKSPLWFLSNLWNFSTMFATLASVCNLFAGKCSDNILVGAQANYYILTHERKPVEEDQQAPMLDIQSPWLQSWGDQEPKSPPARSARDQELRPSSQSARSQESGATPSQSARDQEPKSALNQPDSFAIQTPVSQYISLKVRPPVPSWFIWLSELFWVWLSMAMNVVMSILLQVAMFLKVATFNGKIDDIALVAVSLYFIFELDDKVMASDPKLRPKYRREVLKQTEERQSEPKRLMKVAAFAISVVNWSVPFELFAIILFSWREHDTGFVIGGDPFS